MTATKTHTLAGIAAIFAALGALVVVLQPPLAVPIGLVFLLAALGLSIVVHQRRSRNW